MNDVTNTVCNAVTHTVTSAVTNAVPRCVQNQNQIQSSSYGCLWVSGYSRIRSNGDLGRFGFGVK